MIDVMNISQLQCLGTKAWSQDQGLKLVLRAKAKDNTLETVWLGVINGCRH